MTLSEQAAFYLAESHKARTKDLALIAFGAYVGTVQSMELLNAAGRGAKSATITGRRDERMEGPH